jgi:hypothetical protein
MNQDALMAREALDLRLRLEFGLAGLEEIELWADAWLLAFDKPRDELTDLAFAKRLGANDAFTLLRRLNPAKPGPEDVLRAASSAAAYDLSAAQLRDLINHIEGYAVPVDPGDRSPAGAMMLDSIGLSDAFLHAQQGNLVTMEQVCEDARRYLLEAQRLLSISKADT